MKTEELISEVTSLPVDERVLVADAILRSLNPPESDIDQKWIAIAKRRLGELRSGQTKPVPGEEVFARIWKRFAI